MNRFLRNGFFYILLIFLIPFTAYGADDEKEFANPSDCGMSSNNTVQLYSMSICEQDSGFRIFYKLFPDIYNEFIFPMFQPKYLDRVKDLESDNANIYVGYEIMLVNIIGIIGSSAYYLAFIFIGWYSFLGIIKTMQDGTFMGEDWSPGKTAIKYGILIILMLPVGNGLIVAQIIILTLVLFSIAIANMLLSVFLSYTQVGSDPADLSSNSDKDKIQQDANSALDKGEFSHNRFYANEYARSLVKIATCQIQSENYYFETVVPNLNGSNLESFKKCNFLKASTANMENDAVGSGFTTDPSFIHYKNSENSYDNGSGNISIANQIFFQKDTQNNAQCAAIPGNYDYKCGSLSVSNPNVTNADILSLIKKADVFQVYTSVKGTLDGDSDRKTVESAIYAGWEQILPVLTKELTNDGKKSLTSSDEQYIKTISYYYHQLLLNYALVGSSSYKDGFLGDAKYNSEYYSIATDIATSIIETNCTDNKELQKKSQNLLDNISNISDLKDRQYTSACVYRASTLLGTNSDKSATVTEINENATKLSDMIYNKRAGIESSFQRSFLNMPSDSIYSYIRKKGFASMGGYMFKLMKEKEFDNKMRNTFRNSIQFDIANMGNNYIMVETLSSGTGAANPRLNANFRDITNIFEVLNASLVSKREDLRNVDVSQYTLSFINSKSNEATKNESEMDRIFDFLASPFSSFKLAIGLPENKEIGANVISECVQNVNECPVPIQNPMVSLSDFGHQLIDTGSSFIAASLLVNYIAFKADAFSAKPSIAEGKKMADMDGAMDKFKLGASNTGKFLGNAAKSVGLNMARIMLESLSPLGVLMIFGGIALAYLIPLIPFIAYQTSILSWVVITILSLVIVPIWIAFSFKIVNKTDTNSDIYNAAYQFIMQILLRPVVFLLAFIIGWSLFSIVYMVINFTMASYLSYVMGSQVGVVNAIIAAIMSVIAYCVLLYLLTKQVFEIMNGLIDKIFGYMNIQTNDSQINSQASGIFEKSMMASLIGKEKVTDMLRKNKYSTAQKRQMKKAQRKNEE